MRLCEIARQIVVGLVMAASVSTLASAALYSSDQRLPEPVIGMFKSTPSAMLQQYPDGGFPLSTLVRNLVASDSATLPGIASLLKDASASKEQLRSIITGLAHATQLANRSDKAFAAEIQKAVTANGNDEVIASYKAAVENNETDIPGTDYKAATAKSNKDGFVFEDKAPAPNSVVALPSEARSSLFGAPQPKRPVSGFFPR